MPAATVAGVLAGIQALIELRARRGRAPRAVCLSAGTSSARWLANIASCISQYLPCSPAQCAASAAFGACGWFGSGKSLNTILTLSP